MKTRSKKSALNTSKNRRKPLSDKTNDINRSNVNMKRKNNSKQPKNVGKRQTQKKIVTAPDLNKSNDNSKIVTRRVSKTNKPEIKRVSKIVSPQTKRESKTNKPIIKEDSKIITPQNGRESKIKKPIIKEDSKIVSPRKRRESKINKPEIKEDSKIITPQKGRESKTKKTVIKEDSKIVSPQKRRESKTNKPEIKEDSKIIIPQKGRESKMKNPIIKEDSKILSPQKQCESKTTKPEIKEEKNTKNERLLNLLNIASPENNSDPYEFKFDPKEEPKIKPKKRGRRKRYDSSSDTSDEENNSMKPIVKKIRKKPKIRMSPVERQLRNRLVKINRKSETPLVIKTKIPQVIPEIIAKNNTPVVEIPELSAKPSTPVAEIPETSAKPSTSVVEIPEISANPSTSVVEIPEVIPEINNMSVVDEINEIANTFLEDDFISTPSRIDIISNLIMRKSYKPSTKVFNSTMIHETPQQIPPRSPWRVEISTIPRQFLNSSVKNKSCTPSYTPDITTDNKKQTTLLGFVNRQPKPDLPVTLFEQSPSRPSRKPFGDLSNSMSPIRHISPPKRSDDSLFGFTVLSDSEDKENTPVKRINSPPKIKTSPKQKIEIVTSNTNNVIREEPVDNISIPLFEDLEIKRDEKRYSRQYTRPQPKRKRNVSFYIQSDDEGSDSEVEIHVKKKQKDVLTKEEAEEAERLASHYNSYFEDIENYPLCIE